MPRTFNGNAPKGCEIYASCDDWEIYKTRETAEFWNYKMVSKRKVRKANYWLAVSLKTGKIVNSRDYRLLLEHHPEAFKWMKKELFEESKET